MAYFITPLGSGFFSSHLKHRRTIILSATTVGTALQVIPISKSIWGIRLGLLFLGMAAGIYLPSGIATLTSLVSSRRWGKAIAIHELAPNLSFVAAPLVSEAFFAMVLMEGSFGVIGVLLSPYKNRLRFFGKGGEFLWEAPSFGSFRTLFGEPAFWIMMVLFSLGIRLPGVIILTGFI